MRLNFDVPSPLQYFTSLVQSDEHFPLLEAAVSLAQDEYPELDVQQVLGDVDQLLARLKRRVPPDAPAMQRLRALNQFFFQDLNFGGNVNDYYDPDNSFVHVLLKTRRGIPITLAVLWLELAQGMDLHARGLSFPGHFMVKVNLPKGQVVMDPFTGPLGKLTLTMKWPGKDKPRACRSMPCASSSHNTARVMGMPRRVLSSTCTKLLSGS